MIPKLLFTSKILEFCGQCWELKKKQEVAPYPYTKQKNIGLWSTACRPGHWNSRRTGQTWRSSREGQLREEEAESHYLPMDSKTNRTPLLGKVGKAKVCKITGHKVKTVGLLPQDEEKQCSWQQM